MFELAAVFAGSFTLALSGALMPGPLLTVTIHESARHGFKAGPLLITGHALLEMAVVAAVLHGLGVYLVLPPVTGSIALLGGLLLLYFGVEMVRNGGTLSLEREAAFSHGSARNPILLGIATSLANPYFSIWWATIGLGYLLAITGMGILGVAAFFTGHITADFTWYCLVSFGVSRGRNILKDGIYRNIIRTCGVFLFCFGGWFLIKAESYFASLF